jgi:hypothetical protein
MACGLAAQLAQALLDHAVELATGTNPAAEGAAAGARGDDGPTGEGDRDDLWVIDGGGAIMDVDGADGRAQPSGRTADPVAAIPFLDQVWQAAQLQIPDGSGDRLQCCPASQEKRQTAARYLNALMPQQRAARCCLDCSHPSLPTPSARAHTNARTHTTVHAHTHSHVHTRLGMSATVTAATLGPGAHCHAPLHCTACRPAGRPAGLPGGWARMHAGVRPGGPRHPLLPAGRPSRSRGQQGRRRRAAAGPGRAAA